MSALRYQQDLPGPQKQTDQHDDQLDMVRHRKFLSRSRPQRFV
jgi:hypothetical protein